MNKICRLFIVFALAVPFTAFLSGNLALAGPRAAEAEFHATVAIEHGNQMLAELSNGKLGKTIMHARETLTHAKEAVIHAEADYKETKNKDVKEFINHTKEGIVHLQEEVDHVGKGHGVKVLGHAKAGMIHLKEGFKYLKAS